MSFLKKVEAASAKVKPRVHDPIIMIHLGYQRPYARFGYIDRVTGALTYTKMGNETDPQAIIPQSWMALLRKQHPMYRKRIAEADLNLTTIGPKVEALFIDFGFQTEYFPEKIEVRAPYDPSIKMYGGVVLHAMLKDGAVKIDMYPIKDVKSEEDTAINSAIQEGGRLIKEFVG